jgi:hypothetical protein
MKQVKVTDAHQQGYTYELVAPAGKEFALILHPN